MDIVPVERNLTRDKVTSYVGDITFITQYTNTITLRLGRHYHSTIIGSHHCTLQVLCCLHPSSTLLSKQLCLLLASLVVQYVIHH